MSRHGNNVRSITIWGSIFVLILSYVDDGHGQNISYYYADLLSDFATETFRMIDTIEFIKQDNLNTAAFETGYLNFIILEKYRRIINRYNTTNELATHIRPYIFEFLIYLEEIETAYMEIEHLTNMLKEIERKYNITGDLDQAYEERVIDGIDPEELKKLQKKKDRQKYLAGNVSDSSSSDEDGTGKGKGKGKGKKSKFPPVYINKDRLKKLKLYKKDMNAYIINKLKSTTLPRKSRSQWPIEYGWEIDKDYFW